MPGLSFPPAQSLWRPVGAPPRLYFNSEEAATLAEVPGLTAEKAGLARQASPGLHPVSVVLSPHKPLRLGSRLGAGPGRDLPASS